MRHSLTLHPDSRCDAAARIDVEVARPRPGHLNVRYIVSGEMGHLLLPPAAAPAHTDGLWRHTCFELFVRPSSGEAYYEFNFAPSRQWAAYRFDSHRSGMSLADAAPRIDVQSNATSFELHAALELALPNDAPWRLGLSAVIEEAAGRMSYWALAHPPGRADFHHSDCFAMELAAISCDPSD